VVAKLGIASFMGGKVVINISEGTCFNYEGQGSHLPYK
jgi:hypothetical protein